jgi:hypothetical protein
LSLTRIRLPATITRILGAMPASSAASTALSTSSRTSINGQSAGFVPVCAVSSLTDANSSSREVLKVVRASAVISAPLAAPVPAAYFREAKNCERRLTRRRPAVATPGLLELFLADHRIELDRAGPGRGCGLA